MATIAEKLAALAVTHTLKAAALPAGFTQWPWAVTTGSWSETLGWSPPGWSEMASPGSRGGHYYDVAKVGPGEAATVVGWGSIAGGLIDKRQTSAWLFAQVGDVTADGYQLCLAQTLESEPADNVFTFKLRRFVGGVETLLGETAGVVLEVGGSFAVVKSGGKVSAWVKKNAAAGWALVGAEVSDATFTEGYSGFDGNGSNPRLVDFATGLLEGAVMPLVAIGRSGPDPEAARLGYYVRKPDGSEKRFAGDEPLAEDIPRGFGFGTSIPGGFGNSTLGLTRDPRIDYGDYDVFDEFLARGPGGDVAYEGYNMELPGSADEQVSVTATGWQNYLKDNPTFQEVYVDRDLNRWGPIPTVRRINLLTSNFTPSDGQVVPEASSGLPTTELACEGAWISPWRPVSEMWYDAGPSAVISIIAAFHKAYGGTVANLAGFVAKVITCSDENLANLSQSVDLTSLGAEYSWRFDPSPRQRRALIQLFYEGTPAGGDGVTFPFQFRSLVVIGSAAVPIQGSDAATYGVLASDVVADIVSRAAPLINFTTGGEGSIRQSSYAIPHLIYPEALTAEEAILQASKYDVPDWGVYENRTFFWRPPTEGRQWVARQTEPGCTLRDEGKQGEEIYTGVMVQFTDPAGKTYIVGPPGTPGCDYTNASLQTTDPYNPLIEHDRTKLGKLVVGPTTTLSGAVQLGARWLQEELAVSDRGQATLTGFVRDIHGVWEPAWMVRAGDRIRFDGSDRERRIIETQYSHHEQEVTLTLDSTPHRVPALMERMQVELVAVGMGS